MYICEGFEDRLTMFVTYGKWAEDVHLHRECTENAEAGIEAYRLMQQSSTSIIDESHTCGNALRREYMAPFRDNKWFQGPPH